jgi:hypothetical protein
MKRTSAVIACSILISPAIAHHSDAGVDMNKTVTFEGTIKEFHFTNPHVYFLVEADNPRGQPVEWSIQMGSTIGMTRTGWTRDTLQPGDRVMVTAHPAINGNGYGILAKVDKEGGLGLKPQAPKVAVATDATAKSIEGRWLGKATELDDYEGGTDGFFKAKLVPTAKGKAAEVAYNPLSAESPESQCIVRPTPGMFLASHRYPFDIKFNDDKTITIHSQFWDEVRTVYMDGRGHPKDGKRTNEGHSIGHWEGDTLVVDTTQFADNRSPYETGVPSGAKKHVVERYRLIEGGKKLAVDWMLEDPEYLAAPVTQSLELSYRPDREMIPFTCDKESASRFLRAGDAQPKAGATQQVKR